MKLFVVLRFKVVVDLEHSKIDILFSITATYWTAAASMPQTPVQLVILNLKEVVNTGMFTVSVDMHVGTMVILFL